MVVGRPPSSRAVGAGGGRMEERNLDMGIESEWIYPPSAGQAWPSPPVPAVGRRRVGSGRREVQDGFFDAFVPLSDGFDGLAEADVSLGSPKKL